MALSFRSPVEEVLNRFTSEEQSKIAQPAVSAIAKIEKDFADLFNFKTDEVSKNRLTTAGIYLSPFSYKTHSHPNCKILENHILYNVLPSLIDNSFYFVGVKPNKLEFLKVRHKGLEMIRALNRFVTSKDRVRYPSDFVVLNSREQANYWKSFSELSSPCLEGFVPRALTLKARNYFLHDELHYWSTDEMISFLHIVRPHKILASLVVPSELLAGAEESLNPWCYRFKIEGGTLVYAPDGVYSEAYRQPVSSANWLRISKLILPDGSTYCVDVVHSKFSHHLISITAGDSLVDKRRSFGGFDAISISALRKLSSNVSDCYPISFDTVSKIYRYLRTLKKPDEQSAMAKLSQIIEKPTGREIKFIEDFSKLILQTVTTEKIFCRSLSTTVLAFIIGLFPGCVSKLSKVFKSVSVSDFINQLEPFNFSVDTCQAHYGFRMALNFISMTDSCDLPDAEDLISDHWGDEKLGFKNFRLPQPYRSIRNMDSRFNLFEFSPESAFNFIMKGFGQGYLSDHKFNLLNRKSIQDVFKVLTRSAVGRAILASRVFNVFDKLLLAYEKRISKNFKLYFSTQGIMWFNIVKRTNQRYLNSPNSSALVDVDHIKSFNKVLNQMLNIDPRLHLEKSTFGIYVQGLFGATFEQVWGDSHQVSDPEIPTAINPNIHGFEEVPVLDNLQDPGTFPEQTVENQHFLCNCGVNVPHGCFQFGDYVTEALKFKLDDRLKSRKAALFSRSGNGYSYIGGNHKSKGWPEFLDPILKAAGFETSRFNQCLMQSYDDGASLPAHKDNEKCYDEMHEVLTVNLIGNCLFSLHCGGGEKKVKLLPLHWLLMPSGFQVSHKHSISECSRGRTSLTFRLEKLGSTVSVLSSNVDGPETALEAKGSLGISELEVLKKDLKSSGVGGLTLHLCDCQQSSSTGKFEETKSLIRQSLRVEGFADLDVVKLFSSELKRLNFLDTQVENLVICYAGSLNFLESGGKTVVRLEKGQMSRNNSFNLKSVEPNSVGIVAYKPKMTTGFELRVHNGDCNFSDFTEVLFGVPIRLSREFLPENYRFFDVPGDGDCFWHAVSHLSGVDGLSLKRICESKAAAENSDRLDAQMKPHVWAEREAVAHCCKTHSMKLEIISESEGVTWIFGDDSAKLHGVLKNEDNHFQPGMPKNGCVITAVAEVLGRRPIEVLAVLGKSENSLLFKELQKGGGLNIFELESLFEVFGIHAFVEMGENIIQMNSGGNLTGHFALVDGHLSMSSPSRNKSFSPHAVGRSTVNKSALNILNQAGSEISYVPSVDRAGVLADSFLNATTGVMCSELFNNRGSLMEGVELNRAERKINVILGTFGSGKSYIFKKFIDANSAKSTTFVSPRRVLADMVINELETGKSKRTKKGWSVRTFESFLISIDKIKPGHVLVIDEIQLYPPGYLDLVLLRLPNGVHIYVAGDPCQSNYDNEGDRAIFAEMDSDIVTILNGKSYRYNISSRRFQSPLFKNRLPCRMKENCFSTNENKYSFDDSIEEFAADFSGEAEVVLVGGFEEKKIVKAHMGQNFKCLTFGESTGLTFNKGAILVSCDSMMCDERRWVTALSRFRKTIHFINVTGLSFEGMAMQFHGRCLWKFLSENACEDDIADMLPGKPTFHSGFDVSAGKDEGVKELKLIGDPWLKTEIFLGQEQDMEILEIESECKNEDWFKTHLPITSLETIRANWVAKIMLKEFREVRCGQEVTDQFTDEHSKNNGKVLTNAAERFETIYPRHKGNDSVTFLMAVKKRLKFSNPGAESAKLRAASPFGKVFLDEFLKHVPLNGTHNSVMMAEALKEFEEKKTSKSAATIENHSGRSCKDWLADVAFIFMKSQLCTKYGNRFVNAKAGQTLACFQHSVLCRFAPYMRYVEKKLIEALPNRFYVHSGKSLEELNDWVINSKFAGECTESDYEAFDSSQDHYILIFEVAVMRFLKLPEDLISDYVYIKTNLGSKLGSFSIMRFTGEASTFLFNTMANMLFTFLRYEIKGSEAICFAGDDMCANKRLTVRKKYDGLLKKLRLKAKVEFTTQPTFCGWRLSSVGIFKKPALILERIQIAIETGNLANCIDNYAIEVGYAYKLGEGVKPFMDEEDLNNHYACVRAVIKHQYLMKSDIKSMFKSSC